MSSRFGAKELMAWLRARWHWSLGLVCLAGSVLHILYYFPRTIDDCFIYLRYAENFANGDGLVFNIGERVEGFSSPLWVTLLALGEVLGMGGVSWMKFLSVASFVGMLVGLHRYARVALGLSPWAAWIAPLCIASNCYLVSWSMHGLETPLFLALIVWSGLTLGRYVDEPSRRSLVIFALVGGAFSLSRPEAPMVLAFIAVGVWLRPLARAEFWPRAIRVIKASLPVFAVFLSYLAFRLAYYGLWLPHTYYAKKGNGFNSHGLKQFLGDGAALPEAIFLAGGMLLAAFMLFRRRDGVILFVALANILYVAVVEVDWMPNVRFWMPAWLILPLSWAWAIDRLVPRLSTRRESRPDGEDSAAIAIARPVFWLRSLAAALALTVVVATAYEQARTDMRYSIFSYRSRGSKNWKKPKSAEIWRDTLMCLQHRRPPPIEALHEFDMGMITFVYRLVEADERPLDQTWFVGRDIGRVGYLTPVNVWETAGLFTPYIIDSEWDKRGVVDAAFIEAAMERPVAMTQAPGGAFADALKRHPTLSKRYGPDTRGGWWFVRDRTVKRPTREQVLARYQAVLDKLPEHYYIMNLVAGATGAAIERRYEIVKKKYQSQR